MTKKKPKRSRQSPARKSPSRVYYLLDSKGELFDVHKTRTDAWHDAVGPRFYKGFFIVEYARRGARRYSYKAPMKESTRVR